jgi:long-chain fatty acid transport protein
MSDLETGTTSTVLTAMGMGTEVGKMTIRDFQWPETYGLGIAIQATPNLLVAADVKKINWSDVMGSFKMTYTSGGGLGMTGTADFALPQNWDDQTVFQIGASYKLNDAMTLRVGANISDNPIPSTTVHYLFPAIIEKHYMVGMGYAFSKDSDVNFTLSYAPNVSQTNTGAAAGMVIEHSQTSWQLMYSTRF